jgi:hypothetical protein
MKSLGLLAIVCLLGGCASKPHAAVERPIDAYEDPAGGAAALVFDAPIAQGQPRVSLYRDEREPSAFVGFDAIDATSFYIRTDDRPGLPVDAWIERRAVSERIGTTYR